MSHTLTNYYYYTSITLNFFMRISIKMGSKFCAAQDLEWYYCYIFYICWLRFGYDDLGHMYNAVLHSIEKFCASPKLLLYPCVRMYPCMYVCMYACDCVCVCARACLLVLLQQSCCVSVEKKMRHPHNPKINGLQ